MKSINKGVDQDEVNNYNETKLVQKDQQLQ